MGPPSPSHGWCPLLDDGVEDEQSVTNEKNRFFIHQANGRLLRVFPLGLPPALAWAGPGGQRDIGTPHATMALFFVASVLRGVPCLQSWLLLVPYRPSSKGLWERRGDGRGKGGKSILFFHCKYSYIAFISIEYILQIYMHFVSLSVFMISVRQFVYPYVSLR